jgi:HlyD family secretion protein
VAQGVAATAVQLARVGRHVALGIAGAGLLLLAYQGLTRGTQASGPEGPVGLRSVRVVRADLRQTVVATGRMEPRSRVPTRSEVSGVVRKVHVEQGDRVAQGEPMFELDRERLQDRVNELHAALEARRAAARYDLVGKASLELERARREHERVAQLFGRGVLSEQRFDESLHTLRLAEVALNDARAESAARGAAVLQAEHLLSQAKRDLERAVIRAPIDGLVIERHVDLGAVVADVSSSGGTLLAVVADDRRIRLVADVDENEIAPVRVGQRADVTIDAFPDERFEGVVKKVSSSGTVDRDVSNFEVEIELPPEERIRVGMSADARVVVREHRGVLTIPNGAIVRGAEQPRVRLRDPSSPQGIRLAEIEEIYSDGFRTAIAAGVREGDEIWIPSEATEP